MLALIELLDPSMNVRPDMNEFICGFDLGST